MSQHVPGLPWTEEQWAEVNRVVQDAARRARVASSFLPLVGPLPPGQASVPRLTMRQQPIGAPRLRGEASDRLEIDDGDTLRLTTVSCEVYLTTQQAEDPELASTKQMLDRAASVIGRAEDAIVFRGQPTANAAPAVALPSIVMVQGGQRNLGLLTAGTLTRRVARLPPLPAPAPAAPGPVDSDELVAQIAAAVHGLEGRGQYGPFACVLGQDLYLAASTPAPALVLPSDRIVAFLEGGPLRRSNVVPDHQGVVVALAGSPIDLVVGSDVHVKFLQLTLEPRYVLRVSERFVLRIKQPDAICLLTS